LIHHLSIGPDGQLWVATERGLCFLAGTRFACHNSMSGLPGNRVLWAVPDVHGNLWLGYNIGVARVNAQQLQQSAGNDSATPNLRFFDDADGIANSPDLIGNAPAVLAQDGRLWLTTSQGVAVLDPDHLESNPLPPPVHILGLQADGRRIDLMLPVKLRPLTRNLQFSFTGVSLTVPRKVRFRYRLEGFDHEWHDGGTTREASYTNLTPGSYTFRVCAANNDGIWNDTGAALTFVLIPAWFQTLWFRLLCAVAVVLGVLTLFRLRLRSAQRIMRLRFEERMEERTRIARDLHDHLIQEMVGISMQLEVADELTPGSSGAKSSLQRALLLARSAIANGRLTLQSLRRRPVTRSALVEALRHTADAYPDENRTAVQYRVEGDERLLRPDIAEDLSELGQEALRNALKYAGRGTIQVGLHYGSSAFELRVRDEGRGVSDQVLREGIPGHYGLEGMRERAARIGGQFSIVSAPERGTIVHPSVPASRAYQDLRQSEDGRRAPRGLVRQEKAK
jgi:signal transduction histidine kinase